MSFWKKIVAFFSRYEPVLFVVATLFMLNEVFANGWLVTEDSSAHIYNSIITRELFLHPTPFLKSVFILNPSPVPNSLSHVLLGALSYFFSIEISDKIIHVINVCGMCFAFRFLVRQINPGQPYYSWLIFPFVYSGLFYLGFYNFYMGIILSLTTMAAWLYAEKRSFGIRRVFLLVFLCTLLFFTHLIPFLLFVFVAGMRILFRLFHKNYRTFFVNTGILFSALIPAMILFFIYYTHRTENTGTTVWASAWISVKKLATLHHLSVISMYQQPVAITISCVLFFSLLLSLIFFFRNKSNYAMAEKERFLFWGICWIVVLALIFISPDDFGGSGAMTIRLIELSWFFFLLFLASGKLPEKIIRTLAFFSFASAMIMMHYRQPQIAGLAQDAKKVMKLAGEIPSNCTGAYIPVTENWLRLHIGELAFAEKKSLMLSNYETVHDFFPLLWSKNFIYNYKIGGLSSSDIPCARCYWPEQPGKPDKEIDYLIVCNDKSDTSDCFRQMNDSLKVHYVLREEVPPFRLYESKLFRQNFSY